MNLQELRKDYYEYSEKASNRVRQLAFAGIAIIWLFRLDSSAEGLFPKDLIWPLTLLVLALAFDLLHYVIGAAIWGNLARWFERRGKEEALEHSPAWNYPLIFFFSFKIFFIVFAYIFILKFICFQI